MVQSRFRPPARAGLHASLQRLKSRAFEQSVRAAPSCSSALRDHLGVQAVEALAMLHRLLHAGLRMVVEATAKDATKCRRPANGPAVLPGRRFLNSWKIAGGFPAAIELTGMGSVRQPGRILAKRLVK